MTFELWKTIENEPQNDLKMHRKMATTTILLARFFNNCIALHFVGKEQEQNKWLKMILVKTNVYVSNWPAWTLSLYKYLQTKKKLTVLTSYQEKYVWRLKVFLLNSVSFTLQEFSSMATLISCKTHQRMPFGFIRWNYYENSLGSIQCLKISNNVSYEYTRQKYCFFFLYR